MKERQEIHCHACNRYVQFVIDKSLNGNHVLNCPNCGHEHCRVVRDGEITEDRWDTRNGLPVFMMQATSCTMQALYITTGIYTNTYNQTYSTGNYTTFASDLWAGAGLGN